MADDIRIAAHSDVPKILPLLALHHREGGAYRGHFNAVLVHDRILQLTSPAGFGVIGFVDGEPTARASIGLIVARFWDTGITHLEPLWSFVHPDHRRTDYLKRLIGFAKDTADQMRIPLVGAEEHTPGNEHKRELYARNMGQPTAISVFRHSPNEAKNVA